MTLLKRTLDHARKNKHVPKWKRIMYAILYGASWRTIATGGNHENRD